MKTELAARQYQQLVGSGGRRGASRPAPLPVATLAAPSAAMPRRPRKHAMSAHDHRRRDAARAPAARGHRRSSSASRSRGARPRAAFAVSLVAVTLAAAAAVWLALGIYATRRSPGISRWMPPRRPARPSCWRSRCSCSSSRATISRRARFPILLLSSLYGVCLLLSSDSFLTLFLGLELMSLPVYVLVLLAYRRPERRGGAEVPGPGRHRHGDTADGRLAALRRRADRCRSRRSRARCRRTTRWRRVAVVLVLVAFFLKAAVVPFHAWAPDAYEGAAVPVTAYMATIVKAGVLLAAVRLFGLAPLSPRDGRRRRAAAARCRSSGAISRRCGSRACAA